MPSLIEIILSATDQTGPGFASARANLSGLNAALGQQQATYTSAGAAATQANQQIAVSSQQAAQGAQTVTAAVTSNTNAQQQNAAATRSNASLQDQLDRALLRMRLSATDAAGRVRILTAEQKEAAVAARQTNLTIEEQARADIRLANAERQLNVARNVQARGTGLVLPRTLEQFGTGALAQAGIATGAAILGQQLAQLAGQSTELAIRAETIGTAYEGATRRARIGADDLLNSLRQASRGTVSETELMASANKALALGVGQNTEQIGDLLAIARQKGKDFGETTQQAFEDITIGLGRLSPRILDNLGIILDEDKIYREYAKSIGVAAGKLSDQEKRQALVNDLIKNNSDLISKNAQAQTDAADRIAQAQARQETAEARLGAALLPVKTAYQETFATILEGLTGITRETDRTAQQKILAGSSGLEDYRTQARARTKELYDSGNVIAARQNAMDMPWRSEYDAARQQAQARIAANQVARDDLYRAPAVAPVVAPVAPRTGFAGFGQPISGANVTNIYITNTGAVVTPQNIIDDVERAREERNRRNAYTTAGHQ